MHEFRVEGARVREMPCRDRVQSTRQRSRQVEPRPLDSQALQNNITESPWTVKLSPWQVVRAQRTSVCVTTSSHLCTPPRHPICFPRESEELWHVFSVAGSCNNAKGTPCWLLAPWNAGTPRFLRGAPKDRQFHAKVYALGKIHLKQVL
jgi:hypothetical protein